MAQQRRYAAVLGILVVALFVGVVFAFSSLSGNRSRDFSRGEATDTFTVTNPELIRPSPDAYRRFRAEDSTWRAKYARPVSVRQMMASGGDWKPSPHQLMRDEVYQLTLNGDLEEAAALLEQWLARNPQDLEEIVDLARLYAQLKKTDDAVRWYRKAIDIESAPALREELAQLLLNTGSFALAETEYRTLVALNASNVSYRIGLARALAWGEKPRAAERELVQIVRQFPNDTAAASLLVAVRGSFEPGSEEALVWVRERPDFPAYRIALARAYVREKKYPRAYAQYDTILRRSPTVATMLEAAGAHASAGDSLGNAAMMGRVVDFAPYDTGYRHQYARALTWAGDRRAAIEQYGFLIRQWPTSEYYYGRGQLHMHGNEYSKAIADLGKSVELKPTYEAYALLGDIHRWNGNYKAARSNYVHALALRPNDPLVLAALADVKRLENLVYAASPGADDVGWISNNSYIEDNSGFLYLSAGLSRGFLLNRQWIGSVIFDQRRISQRSANSPERYVSGYTVGGSSTYYAQRWIFSVNGGFARHALVSTTMYAGVSAQTTMRSVTAMVGLSAGPVYNALMSTQALLRFSQNGTTISTRPLNGTTLRAALRVPTGPAEISVDGEQLYLSDGNRRTVISASVRLPVTKRLNAMYVGSTLGYAERSDAYWDPTRYTSHSIGLEYAVRKPTGLSFAVRALPGIARSNESMRLAQDTSLNFAPRTVGQLALNGDLEYRRRNWAIVAAGGYGRGREGGYQSLNGSLRLKLAW